MNRSSLYGLLSMISAAVLIVGCAVFVPHRQGQIVVQVVSWPLVKQWAEPNAGMPGQKVTVLKAEDHSLVAQKITDSSGRLVFNVPGGNYIVRGVSDESEMVTVEAGHAVGLKFIQH